MKYQLFYQTTLKLLKIRSQISLQKVLSCPTEFQGWLNLEKLSATLDPDQLKALYKDIKYFFLRTCPHLRLFEK